MAEEKSDAQTLTMRRPDDFHIHLRDGDSLKLLVPHACAQVARAIVMPNLVPPVKTAEDAAQYKERIMKHVPKNVNFTPLMTLYMTDSTTPKDIQMAKESGIVYGVKLYPKGATTNSDNGVTDISKIKSTLQAMQECDLPLLIHGEVTDKSVDVFDRESVFLSKVLPNVIKMCPKLRIVLEHVTTKDAVEFVKSAGDNVAATITAHHLMSNRNEIFQGGITPHMYCLPIIKTETDRQALVEAAISGNKKFFAGTDSAPHERKTKECCHGKAGIYTGNASVCLYAQIFAENNALDKLEAFMSEHGARFYKLKFNEEKITISQKPQTIPKSFPYLNGELVPYKAGKILDWSLDTEVSRSRM